MALPEQVIDGGTKIGTAGNDDLQTSNYDIITAVTTIYSALSGLGGDDRLDNNGKVENVTLEGGADNDRIYNTVSGGGQSPSIVGGTGNDNIQNGYATDQLKANDATIDAGAGADTVDNYGDNALINLGDGNDSLYNVGDKATISAGAGADNISHFGDDSSIDAGAGDDTVGGYGNNVTVRGGAGNDSLSGYRKNDSGNVKILLDDTQGNNNFRISYSTNSTINAGSGNDTISADYANENLLINAGAGNNSIVTQYGDSVTINTAGGSDTITIYDGSNFVVNAGDGANVIENSRINDTTASGHTITSGAGNDSIVNRVDNVLITAGDGDNTVINGAYGSGGGSNVTINTGSGNDFINNYYDSEHASGAKQENVLINSGAGNDTVTNSTDKVTIDGGAGNDELSSYDSSDVSINGGAGADTIFIANGTVSGGAGNDSISAGNKVLIQYNSGDGNDAVWSFDENSTLSIGGGNYSSAVSGSDVVLTVGNGKITLSEAATLDTLNIVGNGSNSIPNSDNGVTVTGTDAAEQFENKGYNVTINALGGNDTINNYGNHVSINGGKGDDLINTDLDPNADDDVTVRYASGDGNDSVYGHMSDDGAMNYKLQITGAPYSSVIRGEDVILSVDNGSILLYGAADAASMGGINIEGTYSGGDTQSSGILRGTEGNDNLHTWIESGNSIVGAFSEVYGLGGNDTIQNFLPMQLNVKITQADIEKATLDGGNGNDYIQNDAAQCLIVGGDGNDTINNTNSDYYNTTHSGGTLNGGAGSDSIFSQDFNNTTISGGNGNDTISHNGGVNVSISGGAGNDSIRSKAYGVIVGLGTGTNTINGGAGSDIVSISHTTASVEPYVIEYASGDGNDTIYGFTSYDTLSITNGSYTSVKSGNNVILTVGSGKITLQGAGGLSSLNIRGTYSGGDTTPADTIPADDTTTAAAATVAEMILRRTEAGYPAMAALAFDPTTYFGGEPTNYASKENWEITSTDGLKLKGYHYTPENSNDKWVVIVHGYGHNHKHMYRFADFYLDNGYNVLMVDQRAAGDSQGDWLTMGAAESKDIALWTQEIARRYSDAKITLFGVSMGSATVMMAAARSDTQNVTSLVEDCGYTNMMDVVYGLHSNVQAIKDLLPTELIPVLDTVASTFTGYNLSDAAPLKSISSAKMPTLFITGTNDSVVPVSMLTALYDASGATVKEKFIVEGANHGIAGLTDPVGYSNTTFRFLAEANGEGWVTDNAVDSILLRGTKYGDTLTSSGDYVTITAGAGNDSLNNSGENVTFNYASGDGNDVIRGFKSNSTLNLGNANYSSQTSGRDVIVTVGNGKITLVGTSEFMNLNIIGKNEGYNPTTLFIENLTDNKLVTGTEGKEAISNYGTNATINALGGDDTIYSNGENSKINAGKGNDSINNYISNVTFNYASGDGNDTITGFNETSTLSIGGAPYESQISGDDVIVTVGNGKITLQGAATLDKLNIDSSVVTVTPDTQPSGDEKLSAVSNMSKSPVTLTSSVETVDASGRVLPIEIVGNELDNSIVGGWNDDTLNGGAGNDTLTGGKGKNVFVYTAGNDVITDYKAGKDSIQLDGGYTSATLNGSDVVFTTANGSLTVKDAIGKDIDVGDEFVVVGVAPGPETLTVNNQSKTHITLGTNTKTVEAKGRIKRVEIIGNDLDNTISSGVNDDTLTGGAGNDSILGNAGSDIINGDAGNDILRGGSGNDTLNGGAGNDSLWGDSGRDTFIYESGNDVIFGFENMDKLELGGDFTADIDGDNLKLTVGNGSVTLKEFTATSFNINGESYVISEGNFVKR